MTDLDNKIENPVHLTVLHNIPGYFKGTSKSDTRKIKEMMQQMRKEKVEKIGNYKVLKIRDYQLNEVIDINTQEKTETGLPKSNVLYYELENDNWCCIRPSGTEPKIKLYMGVKGISNKEAEENLEILKEAMVKLVKGE